MSLTLTQRSLYLLVYNATMISRSLGKTFKLNDTFSLNDYIKIVFSELEVLCEKMDNQSLTNEDIRNSIQKLHKRFNISYGQSQKAINVILKFHCFLYEKNNNDAIKKELDCPLDSIVLKELNLKYKLTGIDEETYINLQNRISSIEGYKIDFDKIWDKQHQEVLAI